MQIHILGGGAVGQLFAFHLTRTLRAAAAATAAHVDGEPSASSSSSPPAYLLPYLPSSIHTGTTVHIRNPGVAQKLTDAGGIVTLEHKGQSRVQDGILVQGGLGALPGAPPARLPEGTITTGVNAGGAGTQMWQRILDASRYHQLRTHELAEHDLERAGVALFEPHRGPEAHIDALFLCTKADTASFALESLLPRLSARSTVVLTQNGLGLADVLIAKHFPDPTTRPFIILSSLTHGLYRLRRDELHAVHASTGEIYFGVLPDLRLRALPGGPERRAPWPVTDEEQDPTRWPPDTLSLEHIDQHFKSAASATLAYSLAYRDPSLGPPAHEASSLVQTIALLLGAMELKSSWVPMPDFHRRSLRKLAINACINPLTAILECQNGALQPIITPPSSSSRHNSPSPAQSEAERERGQECLGIMRDVCEEISAVVQEHANRSWWAAKARRAAEDGDSEVDMPARWGASDVLDYTSSSAEADEDGQVAYDPNDDSDGDRARGSKVDLLPEGLTKAAPLSDPLSFSQPPPLHPSLTASALYDEVVRVLGLVKDNYSSMYQDVVLHGRASSEVSFVNGYVRRLAEALNEERKRAQAGASRSRSSGPGRHGGKAEDRLEHMKQVHTPVNTMLERLVVSKCGLFGSALAHKSSSGSRRTSASSTSEQAEGRDGAVEPSSYTTAWKRANPSPSFTTAPGPPSHMAGRVIDIEPPARERVGRRKNRVGGYGRLWEIRRREKAIEMQQRRRRQLVEGPPPPLHMSDGQWRGREERDGEVDGNAHSEYADEYADEEQHGENDEDAHGEYAHDQQDGEHDADADGEYADEDADMYYRR